MTQNHRNLTAKVGGRKREREKKEKEGKKKGGRGGKSKRGRGREEDEGRREVKEVFICADQLILIEPSYLLISACDYDVQGVK